MRVGSMPTVLERELIHTAGKVLLRHSVVNQGSSSGQTGRQGVPVEPSSDLRVKTLQQRDMVAQLILWIKGISCRYLPWL